jgi:hypothetical protein
MEESAVARKEITPRDALAIIAKNHPEEAKILTPFVTTNVLTLGTDEAFALRDSSGEIRAFKQRIRLSHADGTLTQPVPGGPFVVSAQVYEAWQEGVGASVIFPKEVLVDGHWNQNPFVMRDPTNKRILAIYARAIAFRFSPKGIPMVCDWTTLFDVPSYRMIDLLAKAKKYPQAFKLLPDGIEPDSDNNETWAKYPFDEAANLWVNTAHEEALQWYAQIINREKKAIDFAQTFARRNALKHLSGLQKAPGNVWDLTIICWRPTNGNLVKWDATQYAHLQDRVTKTIQGDTGEFSNIKQITGNEHVGDDITDLADMGEAMQEENEQGDQRLAPPSDDPAMANLKIAQEEFPEFYEKAIDELGLVGKEDITPDEAKDICTKINEIMDREAGD